jgi:hypothetical protein
MLTRKHFIEFADLLVELDNFERPYLNLLIEIIQTLDSNFMNEVQSKDNPIGLIRHKIDRILNHDKPNLYNNLCKEIMLILDKNSLRFNKYQFKNYIISHVEKKQLNNLKNENTTKLNKVGNMT